MRNLRVNLAAAILLFCSLAAAEQAKTAAPPKEPADITKLADGVYARLVPPDSNAVSNSGIVVLERSVLIFDTHFTPEAGQLLLARIQSLTSKPVRTIVLSHFHPDHTHGAQAFPGGPTIIGSENTRRDMLQQDLPSLNRVLAVTRDQLEKARKEVALETDARVQERMRAAINSRQALADTLSRLKILAPMITFNDSMGIPDSTRQLRLLILGAGHTDGDIVLFLPADRIVFAGDLFFNDAIPNAQDANLLEWMKTLQELAKLDADRFVPGHGPIGTKAEVKAFLAYLENLKSLVQDAMTRGETIEQVLEIPVPVKYAGYRFQNLFRPNLEKMYRELKARQIADAPKFEPD